MAINTEVVCRWAKTQQNLWVRNTGDTYVWPERFQCKFRVIKCTFFPNWSGAWKRQISDQTWVTFDIKGTNTKYMVYGHFRPFDWCICLKIGYDSKTEAHREKKTKMLDHQTLLFHVWYMWPCNIQFMGHTLHLSKNWFIFRNPIKVEWQTEIYDSETVVNVIDWVDFI